MKTKLTLTTAVLMLSAVLAVSVVTAQGTELLAPPTGQPIAANGSEPGQVTVSWNAVEDAEFYRIGWVAVPDLQATVAEGREWLESFRFLDVANTEQTQWTLNRLSPEVQYYFIVGSNTSRYGEPQWSAWSPPLTLTPAPPADYTDQYPDCDALQEHHPGGVKQGSPVYRLDLDPDADGTACEATSSSVPSEDYLSIQNIGTFTGTGDSADTVIRLDAGVYRVTSSRTNTDGNFTVELVELRDGDDRFVGIYGRGESGGSTTHTIYNDDHSSRHQAGNYILQVDTDNDWEIRIELLMAH